MKDLNKIPATQIKPKQSPNGLFSSVRGPTKLAGFAKVLAGGRVVTLDRNKSFEERFLGCSTTQHDQEPHHTSVHQVVLETVVANLEAGVKLVEQQELSLAKFGGRLTEVALALNKSRETPKHSLSAQRDFEISRDKLRLISKDTFDHTALFSNGPSKPITLALPADTHWEGLSIERCDLAKPGFLAIDRGKVCPGAAGLLLDRESIQRAFDEWRSLCVNNLMQSNFVSGKLMLFLGKLKDYIGGKRWQAPPFPDDLSNGPLRRPNLGN